MQELTRTPQELFDTVAKHLLTQNKKSGVRYDTGELECRYHGPDGLKCAIGCLIPDEKYEPEFEGLKATDSIVVRLANLEGVETLADDLQHLHDTFHPNNWPYKLKALANLYKLDPKVVDECTQKNVSC